MLIIWNQKVLNNNFIEYDYMKISNSVRVFIKNKQLILT